MRAQRKPSLREKFSAIRKLAVNQLSLCFLKYFPNASIQIIRDGGLGDCIMAIKLVKAIKNKYPKSELKLSASFPQVFKEIQKNKHSILSFPALWLSYTHYDLNPWKGRSDTHYMQMMASAVDLKIQEGSPIALEIDESQYQKLIKTLQEVDYVVIQPFAGNWFPEKNWDLEKWQLLVQELVAEGINVYQIGLPEEAHIDRAIDFRGKSVEESLLIIKYAELLIGVNSFAEQAAWAYNKCAIILYGPTNPICSINPNQIAVFGDNFYTHEQVQETNYSFPSMNEIEVGTVMEAVVQRELNMK